MARIWRGKPEGLNKAACSKANDDLWPTTVPRFHLHYTPTSASWMNQVETWFSLLHRRALRRGVFRNLGSLVTAIHRFMEAWKENCRPFAWIKTADQILAKANRQVISAAGH